MSKFNSSLFDVNFSAKPFKDQYGNAWPATLICGLTQCSAMDLTSTDYTPTDEDNGRSRSYSIVEDKPDSGIPHKIAYSFEMWAGLANKQDGYDSISYLQDGHAVFTIDCDDPEIEAQWNAFQGDYHQSVFHVVMWHIRERLVK